MTGQQEMPPRPGNSKTYAHRFAYEQVAVVYMDALETELEKVKGELNTVRDERGDWKAIAGNWKRRAEKAKARILALEAELARVKGDLERARHESDAYKKGYFSKIEERNAQYRRAEIAEAALRERQGSVPEDILDIADQLVNAPHKPLYEELQKAGIYILSLQGEHQKEEQRG